MMFLVGRNRRCGHRRNAKLTAILGMLSALMLLAAAWIERHDGEHWPIAVAGVVGVALIGAALIRLAALGRGPDCS
jgi:hypothetical protein